MSGIYALLCHHMVILPSGVINLHHGERRVVQLSDRAVELTSGHRYLYVDFAVVSAIQRYRRLRVLYMSYDIMCQWLINLRTRLEKEFPDTKLPHLKSIQSAQLPKIVGGVGNYHLPMHVAPCRPFFSWHNLPGAGMLVGEEPEGNWGILDDYTAISKQQSAGHREDYTTDVFTARNVQRVHQMGKSYRTPCRE